MTKQEAIAAMLAHKWVRHRLFTDAECIQMEDGEIYDEAGYWLADFWLDRTGPEWMTGWEIYNPQTD